MLAGALRPGNASSNTATNHVTLINGAFAQIPDDQLWGQPILVRSGGAGATMDWLIHLRGVRDERCVHPQFLVGFSVTNQVKDAIEALPGQVNSGCRVWVEATTSPDGRWRLRRELWSRFDRRCP